MSSLTEILISVLLLFGTWSMVVGTLGLVRFPDVYSRLGVNGKASTIGLMLILIAGTIFFSTEFGLTLQPLLVIPFLFGTLPTGAFMIGRAAHRTGPDMAPGTIRDDLARKAGTRRKWW